MTSSRKPNQVVVKRPPSYRKPSRLASSIKQFWQFPWQKKVRYGLAGFSVALCILVPIAIGYWVISRTGSHSYYKPVAYNDILKAAIDIRLDESKNLFQTGLVLVAGLWGLLIAKKEEAVLVFEDKPELTMSSMAGVLFIFSFTCHIFYLRKLTDIYYSAGKIVSDDELDTTLNVKPTTVMPDVFAANIDFLFVAQTTFLVAAAVIAILTFFSAHKLK